MTGLENGIRYAVAIAPYDKVGNVGKLSTLDCATPEDVNDFFDLYREAGGKAGGGFCSVDGPGSAAPRGVFAAAAAAVSGLMLGIRRLVRRRRPARPFGEDHR
jgi:hypothetical protein